MPQGMQIDYSGASRQFKQEGSALLVTFVFALIIIYLVLAAQFESFRDPLIMLVTVPMSICGALLFLNIFGITNGLKLTHFPGMTLNIYTQVGLVTLIGVISKHGILIVEFANKLQQNQGLAKRAAIEEAASIRLRPGADDHRRAGHRHGALAAGRGPRRSGPRPKSSRPLRASVRCGGAGSG